MPFSLRPSSLVAHFVCLLRALVALSRGPPGVVVLLPSQGSEACFCPTLAPPQRIVAATLSPPSYPKLSIGTLPL